MDKQLQQCRKGMVLTKEAQADRDNFNEWDSGCSCHISPPCAYCTHPGNPTNQDEFDECWESALVAEVRRTAHQQNEDGK